MAWTSDAFQIAFSHYSIGDDNTLMPIFMNKLATRRNGLVETGDGYAYIKTGTHSGALRMTVDLTPQPRIPDVDGWETVVDLNYLSVNGNTHLRTWEYIPWPEVGNLSSAGPGWYRIRMKARGWDAGRAVNTATEPVEEHHLSIWPAPPGREVIHKRR